MQVQDLGSGFATVSIRGSTAEQVVVYLDGVPLNRALGGGVNLADLPLAQIESIEIYREWLDLTRPAPGPEGLRRPRWLDRVARPVAEAYHLRRT